MSATAIFLAGARFAAMRSVGGFAGVERSLLASLAHTMPRSSMIGCNANDTTRETLWGHCECAVGEGAHTACRSAEERRRTYITRLGVLELAATAALAHIEAACQDTSRGVAPRVLEFSQGSRFRA